MKKSKILVTLLGFVFTSSIFAAERALVVWQPQPAYLHDAPAAAPVALEALGAQQPAPQQVDPQRALDEELGLGWANWGTEADAINYPAEVIRRRKARAQDALRDQELAEENAFRENNWFFPGLRLSFHKNVVRPVASMGQLFSMQSLFNGASRFWHFGKYPMATSSAAMVALLVKPQLGKYADNIFLGALGTGLALGLYNGNADYRAVRDQAAVTENLREQIRVAGQALYRVDGERRGLEQTRIAVQELLQQQRGLQERMAQLQEAARLAREQSAEAVRLSEQRAAEAIRHSEEQTREIIARSEAQAAEAAARSQALQVEVLESNNRLQVVNQNLEEQRAALELVEQRLDDQGQALLQGAERLEIMNADSRRTQIALATLKSLMAVNHLTAIPSICYQDFQLRQNRLMLKKIMYPNQNPELVVDEIMEYQQLEDERTQLLEVYRHIMDVIQSQRRANPEVLAELRQLFGANVRPLEELLANFSNPRARALQLPADWVQQPAQAEGPAEQ